MLSRFGTRAVARVPLRALTTKTSITDHLTGKVIPLADPARPELADYQNPEPELAQLRDPYAKYDFQQMRRNKDEPMSIDDDLYDMWSPDYYQFVSDKTALKQNGIFFGVVLGFGALIAYFQLNPEKPAMPRSFPYNGLAKDLGSGADKDDYFYKVRTDSTADALGTLADDSEIAAQKEAYLLANADFFKA